MCIYITIHTRKQEVQRKQYKVTETKELLKLLCISDHIFWYQNLLKYNALQRITLGILVIYGTDINNMSIDLKIMYKLISTNIGIYQVYLFKSYDTKVYKMAFEAEIVVKKKHAKKCKIDRKTISDIKYINVFPTNIYSKAVKTYRIISRLNGMLLTYGMREVIP